jgi:hypothetical protein
MCDAGTVKGALAAFARAYDAVDVTALESLVSFARGDLAAELLSRAADGERLCGVRFPYDGLGRAHQFARFRLRGHRVEGGRWRHASGSGAWTARTLQRPFTTDLPLTTRRPSTAIRTRQSIRAASVLAESDL